MGKSGGPWCKANLGVDYDAFKAKARKGDPEVWARMFGLNLSGTFSMGQLGEACAATFAAGWARKMQYYYDCFRDAPAGGGFRLHRRCRRRLPRGGEFAACVAALSVGDRAASQRAQQVRALRPLSKAKH